MTTAQIAKAKKEIRRQQDEWIAKEADRAIRQGGYHGLSDHFRAIDR
jgi:hypothetical protein